MGARYALYFVPHASHPLWDAGCAWLGRDAAAEANRMPLPIPRLASDLFAQANAAPRRYGLHATPGIEPTTPCFVGIQGVFNQSSDVQDRVGLVWVLLAIRDGVCRRHDDQFDSPTLGLVLHRLHDR